MERWMDEARHCHQKPKCCKKCVGAFNVEHKIYEVCCYHIVRVCPRCGCEHDHRHQCCPHCNLEIREMLDGRLEHYGGFMNGYQPEMMEWKSKEAMEDPEEEY